MSRHGSQARRTTRLGRARDRHASATKMRTRQRSVRMGQSLLALCRDRDLYVETLFPGQLGGLGCDRGFLCHKRDFSALRCDRNSVSRQGLGLGQVCVSTRVSSCGNRVFLVVGHSYRNRRLYVETEIPGIWDFPCHDMGLMSRQYMTEACSNRAP